MSELPDNEIDALLREVAVPEGFLSRLKSSLEFSEADVDAALAQIAVPQVLLSRLKEIPLDEWVDRSLTNVPVPFEIVWQARKSTIADRAGRFVDQATHAALAAALFVALALARFSGTAILVGSAFPRPDVEIQPTFVAYNGPMTVESQPAEEEPAVIFTGIAPLAESVQLVSNQGPSIFDIESPDTGNELPFGAVGLWQASLANGVLPFDDVVRMRWGVMSYGSFSEDVPGELDSPRLPLAAGMESPLFGPGRAFFLRHRTHPPVEPSAGELLALAAVPLSTRVQSYLEVQKLAGQNRRPDPRQIRVEDFLASVNYRFPLPEPGTLGIRTAAGPSVFGPEGTALLQVGVQAGALQRPTSEGTHLVLAIDLSSSMSRGSRLNEVRQGVSRLFDQLEPGDYLSLVLFQEEVVERVEKASAGDKEGLKRLLLSVEPHGGTDLAAGLQQAMTLLLSDSLPQDKRLVLITDSRVIMPQTTESQIRSLLAEGEAVGAKMQILDVSDRSEIDPALAQWAKVLSGDARRTPDAGRIYWHLLEMLSGRSPVVASEAKLSVRFNPVCVAAWRLIGHDANSFAAINPPSLDAELKAGEAATGLFEIWFKPGESDDVGQAELTWKDPASGSARRVLQRISRLQFAPSAAEMPLCLQQAALAAETAEVLKGSRDALRELGLIPANSRGLEGVLAAGRTVHPRLVQRPDFQAFLEFVARLEKLEKK
ncbi:MAG: VWA domain-containing protein [Pirellulaceae bacterium]|nr:VWA domain-containing protein [Pirellulaceae bacterium]